MPKQITSKDEIIAIATNVFKKYGYPNTSIAMLAEACGIQKAHFYYYFENKEAIMLGVLNEIYNLTNREMILPAWNEEIEKSKRLQYFLTYFEILYTDGRGMIMANTIMQTLEAHRLFIDIAQKYYKMLIATIAHLYEDRYSPTYAVGKAEQAVQDLLGSLMMSQIFEDYSYFKGALKRVGKKV